MLMGVTNGCSLRVLTLTLFSFGTAWSPDGKTIAFTSCWSQRKGFVLCFGPSRSPMDRSVKSIRRRALSAVRTGCRMEAGLLASIGNIDQSFVGNSGSFPFQTEKHSVLRTT